MLCSPFFEHLWSIHFVPDSELCPQGAHSWVLGVGVEKGERRDLRVQGSYLTSVNTAALLGGYVGNPCTEQQCTHTD